MTTEYGLALLNHYSWLARHVNKWLTMIGWSFCARHVSDFWSENVSSRHSVARPVQRWANDGSGFQGFPWCCSAWKLFSPLRLYRMCPVIGLHLPRIQSNDLSYTVSVSHVSSPTICPTWSKQMSYSVTFYHIYVFIVGFPAIIPTSSILRAVYADLL